MFKKADRLNTKVVRGFLTLAATVVVSLTLKSASGYFLRNEREFLSKQSWVVLFLYLSWKSKTILTLFDIFVRFFFDITKSPTYEILLLFVLIASVATGFFTSFTLFFFVICGTLASHFKIVQKEVKFLMHEDQNEEVKHYKIKSIINYHEKLLHLCKTLNEIYSFVFFIQIIYMTELIVLIGFQIITVHILVNEYRNSEVIIFIFRLMT